jgi:hypothetical protein
MKLDFAKLKETVSIQQAAALVELKLTKNGDAYRSPCPACNSGGDRAIVITPAKAAYYCFAQKKGGDCIKPGSPHQGHRSARGSGMDHGTASAAAGKHSPEGQFQRWCAQGEKHRGNSTHPFLPGETGE